MSPAVSPTATSSAQEDSSTQWAHTRCRVAELTTRIDALIAERKLLQEELDSIVYPILSLPSEISSHIFVQSIRADITECRPVPHTAHLLFTQICRQWRAVALTTPCLWRTVALGERQNQHRDSGQLLEMWFEHSGRLPMRLYFHTPDGAETQALVDASLIDCDHRDLDVQIPWAQLTTIAFKTCGSVSACLPFLTQCTGPLSRLTHMCAPVSQEDTSIQPQITLDNLVSMELEYYAQHTGAALVAYLTLPRLQKLTFLGFLSPAMDALRDFFSRSFCQLRQLTFGQPYGTTRPEDLSLFLQLVPTVTDLTLKFSENRFFACLRSSDILPSLEHLSIETVRDHPPAD